MTIFNGLFDTSTTNLISIGDFILCIGISLLVGLIIAAAYMYKGRYTNSFVATLALLPSIVCVVIMMVNGNVGAGVAVAGSFSLVRFRSVPGTAKEIGVIFLAMAAGLTAGMGYLAYAILLSIVLSLVMMAYSHLSLGFKKGNYLNKTMRITIPEDLDYTGIFDDLFTTYTTDYELTTVKTTNLGSLFKLTYNLTLKDSSKEKEFIDAIRCRNGNLEITVSKQETTATEL